MRNKPDYHKEIDHLCKQLRKDLELYKRASQGEKKRLMASMDEKVKLLIAAAEELRKAGAHKQDLKLAKSYKAFVQSDRDEHFSALQQDLYTLAEYNQLHLPK